MNKFFVLLFFIGSFQTAIAQDTLLLITGRTIIVSSVDLSGGTIAYRTNDEKRKLKDIHPDRVFSIKYKDGNERIIYMPDSLDPIDFKVEEMRNFIKGEQDSKELYKNNLIKIGGVVVGAGSAIYGLFYGLIGPPVYATVIGSFSPNIENRLSFDVAGSAATEIGIPPGNYMNNISGTNTSPVIKKGQELKIGGTKLKFTEDASLDSTISLINSRFKCTLVHATNDNGKIKLYKSSTPELLNDLPYREGFEKKARDYKIRNGMLSALAGFVAGFVVYTTAFKD